MLYNLLGKFFFLRGKNQASCKLKKKRKKNQIMNIQADKI